MQNFEEMDPKTILRSYYGYDSFRANQEEIINTVSEEVHRFVKDAEQSDDLTLLAIHYQYNTGKKD